MKGGGQTDTRGGPRIRINVNKRVIAQSRALRVENRPMVEKTGHATFA